MIHSMTGYAAASAEITGGTLNVELRSVNSRYLDIQFRVADELRMLEAGLREALAGKLSRGKVDCRISLSTTATGPRAQALNVAALEELGKLAAIVKKEMPEAAPLRTTDVLRWPGVLAEGTVSEVELREQASAIGTKAIGELTAARAREGAKLAGVIRERVAAMRKSVAAVAPLVPDAIARTMERLPWESLYWSLLSSRKRRTNESMTAAPSVEESFRHLIAIGSSSPTWRPR